MTIWRTIRQRNVKRQSACPRCGGPATATAGPHLWSRTVVECPRCDLRDRWADSPERRRV